MKLICIKIGLVFGGLCTWQSAMAQDLSTSSHKDSMGKAKLIVLKEGTSLKEGFQAMDSFIWSTVKSDSSNSSADSLKPRSALFIVEKNGTYFETPEGEYQEDAYEPEPKNKTRRKRRVFVRSNRVCIPLQIRNPNFK